MARITDAEIERLKSEVSVQRLAAARGVVLRQRGDAQMGLCPFHEDHSPSLVINVAKNVWHCLGACQAGGSVIDWVMRAEGISFRHAVELLRKDVTAISPASSSKKTAKRCTVAKLETFIDSDVNTNEQLHQVMDYYHETLKSSPEALAYLEKRGLSSSEVVKRFRLGFANRTIGYHLPQKTGKLVRRFVAGWRRSESFVRAVMSISAGHW